MPESIEDIQARYVAALRAILPELDAWWQAMVERHGTDGVWLRWPTGMAGHPRVLAIFREHWFEIEALNEAAVAPPPALPREQEDLWGEDTDEEDIEFHDHAEWLIHNIADDAPDLQGLVDGLCYVPIGEDLNEEAA